MKGLIRHNSKSQSFSRGFGSILPTSLTYIILINQRLLTLETCCGYWYGQKIKKKIISFIKKNKKNLISFFSFSILFMLLYNLYYI